MEFKTLQNCILGRIEDLVNQMVVHQENGDDDLKMLLHNEIQELKAAINSDDQADNFFFVKDHKFLA